MLHNLLNNRKYLSKWKDIYPLCVLVAMIVLKQTNIYCMNVKMSKKYGILKFDVSWKHIVVGFYHEMNEKQ